MIKKISFSFMTDMVDYLEGGLCGNIIQEKWVNDRLIELDSDAAELGTYFEYYFTLLVTGKGSLPKNGKIPERKMYKDGSKPLSEYARAEKNAVRLKDYFEKMGLKIIAAGKKITKGRFEGTIDLICECTKSINFGQMEWIEGSHVVIDIKYSGLIEDKWKQFGWAGMLQPGPHIQKDYHGKQAKQYHHLTDLPFYFLVCSSTNETDITLLHLPMQEDYLIDEHIKEGNSLFEKFEFEAKIGFEARPEISACNKCPLKDECKDRHTFPNPKIVTI
jgi:hypothetical protein